MITNEKERAEAIESIHTIRVLCKDVEHTLTNMREYDRNYSTARVKETIRCMRRMLLELSKDV